MGHIHIPHDWQRDPFPGSCPYHGDCFEGLASGPALARRWGQKAETFPAGHAAWSLEAHYLALALINYTCTVSPQRIIIGGGVMSQTELYPIVRREFQQILNGYIVSPDINSHIEGYIVPPGLGNRSGVLGAIALAQLAAGA
jgi:fructokinase